MYSQQNTNSVFCWLYIKNDNKLILYKSCIRSVMTYAAPVWSNTSSSNYRRLQTLQSKYLRVICNFSRCTHIPPSMCYKFTNQSILWPHAFSILPPVTQIPLYVSSETTRYEIFISNTKSTAINELNTSYSQLLLKTTCISVFSIV
jgi:hypothetical protein